MSLGFSHYISEPAVGKLVYHLPTERVLRVEPHANRRGRFARSSDGRLHVIQLIDMSMASMTDEREFAGEQALFEWRLNTRTR